MSIDIFNINDKCAIEDCSLVLLIIIVFIIVFMLVFAYIIRRKLRSNKGKIHGKINKSQTQSLPFEIPKKGEVTMNGRKKNIPRKLLKPKRIEKQKKITKISVPINTRERFSVQIDPLQLDVQYFENSPQKKIPTPVEKNSIKTDKNKNILINETLYKERLKHKKQMFPDDHSIQFENISNFSFESKNNSVASFYQNKNKAKSNEKIVESTEKFIKIILFQKEEEPDTNKIRPNFFNINQEKRKNCYIDKDLTRFPNEKRTIIPNESIKIIRFDEY